ncbi:hypothetical protein KY360_05950 [Candidatus Woesearchaeota archaeon]|nr:hypothetical protein [Candidatus Woesearchaeota archaeon]
MSKKILLMTGMLLLFILPAVSASSLRIISTDYAKTIYPCNPISFGFTIQNIGGYAETYYLNVDQFGGYTAFSQNPIRLDPYRSQELFAFITPGCDITGSYTFNIIVKALNSNQEVMLPIQLNIINNYNYGVSFGEYYIENQPVQVSSDGYYKICEEDIGYIPIIIENNAYIQNSYKIALNAPRFASLTQDSAVLNGLQDGVIFIRLEPKLKNKGTHFIAAYVVPQRGDAKKTGTVRVDVEECYDVGLDLPKEATVAGCELSAHELNIKNKGSYDNTFNLYLEAPGWVSLDYNAQEINAGSSSTATLNIDAPCDTKGTETVVISANSQEHENIKDAKTLALEVIPQGRFYHAIIDAPKQTNIRYDAKELPIKVTNNGFKEITYSLSLTAPEWVDIEPKTITLKPKETAYPKLVFNINEEVEENDYTATITAAVGAVAYSKDVGLRLKNEFFSQKIAAWLNYYLYYLIAGFVLLIVLVLVGILVKGKFGRKKTKKPRITASIKSRKKVSKPTGKLELLNKLKSVDKYVYIAATAVIILGAIAYLIREVLSGFLSIYIWYIIAGLVILAVILGILITLDKKKSKKR